MKRIKDIELKEVSIINNHIEVGYTYTEEERNMSEEPLKTEQFDEGKIDWKYIYRNLILPNDQDKRLQFLHRAPTEAQFKRLQEAFPKENYWGYSNQRNHTKYLLIWEAVQKAYQQIRDLRYESQGFTHSEVHGKTFLFKKCLEEIRLVVHNFVDWGNILEREFQSVFDLHWDRVMKEYEPIHTVLSASVSFTLTDPKTGNTYQSDKIDLTKNEKRLLLRAFYPSFEKAWNEFCSFNWSEEYTKLWEVVFKYVVEYQKIETQAAAEVKRLEEQSKLNRIAEGIATCIEKKQIVMDPQVPILTQELVKEIKLFTTKEKRKIEEIRKALEENP